MSLDTPSWNLSLLVLLGVATIVGFYMGHAARRIRLPSLIGYMVLGVLLGPSVLHLLNERDMERLSFSTEVGLRLVAFTIGAELSLSSLKHLGSSILLIILTESFAVFFVVTGAVCALSHDLDLSLVFGAMAPASAPAGTVAVIQERKAKGSLTKALCAVAGFDDGLAIVIFGLAAAFAKMLDLRRTRVFGRAFREASWPCL